jgi:RND family efflux transporter MFP subunit
MRVVPQVIMVALIAAVAVPLSARYVPGTHPWLDRIGVLRPLTTMGVVTEGATDTSGGPDERNGAGREVPVIAGPIQSMVAQSVVSAIGTARGVQSVELSFEVTGRVTALAVAPGDHVEAGAVIAELDGEAAELSVERARLVLENARKTVERLGLLAQTGTATVLQRQDAELALRVAEVELQVAERVLADHSLLAPVSGYVGLIEPQLGDLVSSATVVTSIEDRSSLLLDFRVPERFAALVRIGDPVQASAISSPRDLVEGRIVAVDNRVDDASRTLRVQAIVDNADDLFRSGMAFQISLVFVGAEHPAVDPLAIQWGAEGAFIWIVREGKATRLPIRILQRNADAVLVDAELQPADMVVTEGVQALRPGADVVVVPPRS